MKPVLQYFFVAVFAIFIGSQITEGVLLLPYWKSLTAIEFYTFYNNFGHTIGGFYTVLTIIAVIIPLFVAFYYKIKKQKGYSFAFISAVFALLFLASFLCHFADQFLHLVQIGVFNIGEPRFAENVVHKLLRFAFCLQQVLALHKITHLLPQVVAVALYNRKCRAFIALQLDDSSADLLFPECIENAPRELPTLGEHCDVSQPNALTGTVNGQR